MKVWGSRGMEKLIGKGDVFIQNDKFLFAVVASFHLFGSVGCVIYVRVSVCGRLFGVKMLVPVNKSESNLLKAPKSSVQLCLPYTVSINVVVDRVNV